MVPLTKDKVLFINKMEPSHNSLIIINVILNFEFSQDVMLIRGILRVNLSAWTGTKFILSPLPFFNSLPIVMFLDLFYFTSGYSCRITKILGRPLNCIKEKIGHEI